MKAMGHADMKTTMIYVDVGKPHIREQVGKLDRIMVTQPPQRIQALPLSHSVTEGGPRTPTGFPTTLKRNRSI